MIRVVRCPNHPKFLLEEDGGKDNFTYYKCEKGERYKLDIPKQILIDFRERE